MSQGTEGETKEETIVVFFSEVSPGNGTMLAQSKHSDVMHDLRSELDALGAIEYCAVYDAARHDFVELSVHLNVTLGECVRKIQSAWDPLHDCNLATLE